MDIVQPGVVLEPLGLLPGDPRRLLLGFSREEADGTIRPWVFVIQPDGTEVRSVRLPALGYRKPPELGIDELQCDWTPERPEVVIVTSERIFSSFLVRDGGLDLDSVRMGMDESMHLYYDRVFGEGAFDKRLEAAGGFFSLLDELRDEIRVEEGRG